MSNFRQKTFEIIFEHDTKWGKRFDVWLILVVLASVLVVMVETINGLADTYGSVFLAVEWFFTILFTIELALRLYCIDNKFRYILSFYGIVDIISILPSYLSFFIPGAQSLIIIRALRMLRIFRILKLNQYTQAGSQITEALLASKAKIIVFLGFITTSVLIIGALMYLVEGEANGFTSIPVSVYWAIVTMTTVGYGDITPQTPLGQMLSSALMIIGYGVLAVPTGIVTAEMTKQNYAEECGICDTQIVARAKYCHNCGNKVRV